MILRSGRVIGAPLAPPSPTPPPNDAAVAIGATPVAPQPAPHFPVDIDVDFVQISALPAFRRPPLPHGRRTNPTSRRCLAPPPIPLSRTNCIATHHRNRHNRHSRRLSCISRPPSAPRNSVRADRSGKSGTRSVGSTSKATVITPTTKATFGSHNDLDPDPDPDTTHDSDPGPDLLLLDWPNAMVLLLRYLECGLATLGSLV